MYLPYKCIATLLSGVFSWITINYLLGRFEPKYHHHTLPAVGLDPAGALGDTEAGGGGNRTLYKISTVGSLDMGGASLQVAFEIPHDVSMTSAMSSKRMYGKVVEYVFNNPLNTNTQPLYHSQT